MATFEVHLQSGTQFEIIPNIISFIGEDASGKFGILAHHARMMTCLNYGLASYKSTEEVVTYLALPGGVLYFSENVLYLCTQHYLRSNDYQEIETAIEKSLLVEEEHVKSMKESLHRLDEAMFRRLWELQRHEA